jgi:hypothetical protein
MFGAGGAEVRTLRVGDVRLQKIPGDLVVMPFAYSDGTCEALFG